MTLINQSSTLPQFSLGNLIYTFFKFLYKCNSQTKYEFCTFIKTLQIVLKMFALFFGYLFGDELTFNFRMCTQFPHPISILTTS